MYINIQNMLSASQNRIIIIHQSYREFKHIQKAQIDFMECIAKVPYARKEI